MNRNTIIGLILIFAIFIGWSYWMQPSEEELEQQRQEQLDRARQKRVSDSAEAAYNAAQRENEARMQEQQAALPPISGDDSSAVYQQLSSNYGAFRMSGIGEEEFITIESDLLKLRFSTRGGKVYAVELKEYKTWDSVPLVLFDADSAKFGFNFYSHNKSLNTNNLYFVPEQVDGKELVGNYMKVSGKDSLSLVMRLYADQGNGQPDKNRYVEHVYTVRGDQYMIDYNLNINGLENDISTYLPYTLELDWNTFLRKQEKIQDRLSGTTIYYRSKDKEVDFLSESDSDEKEFVDKLDWISLKQRFFSSTIIFDNGFFDNPKLAHSTHENPVSDRYLKSTRVKVNIPVDNFSNSSADFRMYFGPNAYNILRDYHLDLERQIPLGWSFFLLQWINRYAVIPVFNWLGSYGWNYGIVILMLTIMLKIVLFPIAYKTYRSTAKMRVLKPEVDEINKKYPKKEDAMKKQQATMALYRSVGVNPMAGCVPMLLQFPILIAMFRFFPSSIELRQQSFLWADDLSSFDSIASLPFEIPFYGDHVSLFTLLMTVSTIIYTWMNNQMMSSSQQMPGMKTMMYIMPVMFLGWFNNYASGLSYYYLLANLFTFGQMFVIRKTINEDKIYKQLQENKKKPKKQSGFQKRLEEAARKRQYPPKKKK